MFIERFWRSLKYQCVYLHAFETGSELRVGLSHRIGCNNARRPHSTLAGRSCLQIRSAKPMEWQRRGRPDEAYRTEKLAA